jgi:hypothetical protein
MVNVLLKAEPGPTFTGYQNILRMTEAGRGGFFFQHDWFYFLHIEKRFIKDGSARLSVSICFGGHQGCIADLPQTTCRG